MYQRFVELLQNKGAKPADITRATGLKSTVFSEWKSGKSKPNAEKLVKIARYLNTTVEYLVTGENDVPLPRLSLDEEALLADFRNLNKLGREKAAEYISDLAGNEKYKKDTPGTRTNVG